MELYRDGEVIQAVATCSFFFGLSVYGVNNQDNWVQVERLQFMVWAILSGTTCWLVSVLGQRVHAVSMWLIQGEHSEVCFALMSYLHHVRCSNLTQLIAR